MIYDIDVRCEMRAWDEREIRILNPLCDFFFSFFFSGAVFFSLEIRVTQRIRDQRIDRGGGGDTKHTTRGVQSYKIFNRLISSHQPSSQSEPLRVSTMADSKEVFEKSQTQQEEEMEYLEGESANFKKAFDDPEFRKVSTEYMDEMQNPNNRQVGRLIALLAHPTMCAFARVCTLYSVHYVLFEISRSQNTEQNIWCLGTPRWLHTESY